MTKEDNKNMSFICFGAEDWWYHNHGHVDIQLMKRFAGMGTTLYVNSIVIQKPKLKKGGNFFRKVIRKLKSILAGLKKIDEGFWVYSPFTLPVHHIPGIQSINEFCLRMQIKRVMRKLEIRNPIILVACPGACDTSIKLQKSKLIWLKTDRWEEYPNIDAEIIKKYDAKLKANADLTVFVSRLLYDVECGQCKKALYLDHGVDYEMFANVTKDENIPPDIADIPKPVVGFFGGIDDHTSDIAFVEDVINLLPEMSFVFVGKVSADVSGFQGKQNVWLLGQKPYEQIPHYGKCFDVAIMPWRQNCWIQACNPIKLKEYLALGKPVVSTPFAELQNYRDLVYQAKSPDEYARSIKTALADDTPERIAARRKKVEKFTWEYKAQSVLTEIFGSSHSLN